LFQISKWKILFQVYWMKEKLSFKTRRYFKIFE
jgi:hypothetical protein